MKKTNVIWAKDGHEKYMQFSSRKEAFLSAKDPVYWPLEIHEYKGMMVVVSDEKTGKELKAVTVS